MNILNDIQNIINILEGGTWDEIRSAPYGLMGVGNTAANQYTARRLAASGQSMNATDMNELSMSRARRGLGGTILGGLVGAGLGALTAQPGYAQRNALAAGLGGLVAGNLIGRGSANNSFVNQRLNSQMAQMPA